MANTTTSSSVKTTFYRVNVEKQTLEEDPRYKGWRSVYEADKRRGRKRK